MTNIPYERAALPEWGEPIPTPGDSCPEWLTRELVEVADFTNGDGVWFLDRYHGRRLSPSMLDGFKDWAWGYINTVRFPKGHPIYAQRQLEAAGYTVTPPAPPEPDYEAYREKLVAFYEAKNLGAAARAVDRGDVLSFNAKANIKALIAAGVTP